VRVLFASTRGAGHFGPLVPFLEACIRRGNEVLVVGPPELDPRGFPFRAGASPPPDELGRTWARVASVPPGQGDVVTVGSIFARLNVRAMLPPLREAIEEWRPDVVVRESAEFASAIAAEELGVPHLRLAVWLAAVEHFALGTATPALDEVAPGVVDRIAASPCVSRFPASFDPATFPVHRFRDPSLDVPPGSHADPSPDDARPLVYMSFGTAAPWMALAPAVYRAALDAVRDLPVRVLISLGGGALELDAVPANVHVEPWVSERDLLGAVSAVVCHGGSGTTLGALAAGVPIVVVPLFGDQPLNGARVAAARAGVVVEGHDLRAALERVLASRSYHTGAERLAAEMRALPPADEFLDWM
jgi:UDP-glucoronosyl and UDP-glucosyl transferase